MALEPAKSLLFALGIVLEAAITRQLIACVAVVNSGIHIFRIILNWRLVRKFRQASSKKSNAAGQSRQACFEVDSNA